jgi:hypothetical protein
MFGKLSNKVTYMYKMFRAKGLSYKLLGLEYPYKCASRECAAIFLEAWSMP